MRDWIKAFFLLSSTERKGIIFMIVLCLFIYLTPILLDRCIGNSVEGFPMIRIDTLEQESFQSKLELISNQHPLEKNSNSGKIDPNLLSFDEIRSLGFDERIAKRWLSLRKSGMIFQNIQDLKKIYGIDVALLNSLSGRFKFSGENSEEQSKVKPYFRKTKDEKVDISLADSAELESLPGIGAKLASRIIKYRERLGGFYAVEQVLEVYGIDSVSYQMFSAKIRASANHLEKLNVNRLEFKDLIQHPYLKQGNTVKLLLNYRKQHGPYTSFEDLKNKILVSPEIVNKIKPYLVFE